MSQMKEQDKTPEEELSDVEIGNLPKKELRVMIIKMLKELWRRMDELKGELQQRENATTKRVSQNRRTL